MAYEIKCDDCKTTMGQTNLLQVSAAGGRCAVCRGYTKGRKAWTATRKLSLWPDGRRPGVIVFSFPGKELVRFLPDSARSGQAETWHWKHVHLEEAHA